MPIDKSVFSLSQSKSYFLMFTAFLLGFSFPTSIVLVNVSLILVVLSIIINRDFSQALALVKQPLFYIPLIMFLILLASLFYADNAYGKSMLSKYRKLLYIFPLALFFLQDRRLALTAIKGFVVANTLVLAVSLLAALNWFNVFNIDPENPTVFHLHITQNFFMAIACLIWLIQVFRTTGWQRAVYGILLVLGLFDVLFLVLGRIGYVAIAVGLGGWLWLVLNNKQRVMLIIAGVIAVVVIALVPNRLQDRVMKGVNEIEQCVTELDPNVATPKICSTSMGLRTEFVYRSLLLIKSSPVIGVGVGGFNYNSDDGKYRHINPHNEYLIQTLQSGIIGLAIFLLWIFFMYRAAYLLPGVEKTFLIAVISVYVAGCLFNSFIVDSYEGQAWMVLVGYLAAEMARRSRDKELVN